MNETHDSNRSIWMALVGVTLLALYLCWKMLQPFVFVLLWSVSLVILFFPVQTWFEKKTKKPGLSAGLSILVVVLTFLLPLSVIIPLVTAEVTRVTSGANADIQGFLDAPTQHPVIRPIYERVMAVPHMKDLLSPATIQQVLTKVGEVLIAGTFSLVGNAVATIISMFFSLFTMFYLFRDGDELVKAMARWLPLEDRVAGKLLRRANDIIQASVYGVLVIAAIQGTLGGVMFWLLGLPSALLWGALMMLMSTIPMLGAFIVWVPAAIYLAATGDWTKAIVLTIWGGVVIGMADNFLRPRLVGSRAQMHELLIFFSVLGGLKVFGILGLILGPVVVAMTIVLFEIFRYGDASSHLPATTVVQTRQAE